MANRAQRRAMKKKNKGVPGYHALTKEQKIQRLMQQGISPQDLEDEYRKGRQQGLKDSSDYIVKLIYAACVKTAHEEFGFDSDACIRLLNAMDSTVTNTFISDDLIDEVYDTLGIQIQFRDPEGIASAKEPVNKTLDCIDGWNILASIVPAKEGKYLACTETGSVFVTKWDNEAKVFAGATGKSIRYWKEIPAVPDFLRKGK